MLVTRRADLLPADDDARPGHVAVTFAELPQRMNHAQRAAEYRRKRADADAATAATAAKLAEEISTREGIASKVARGWSRLPPPRSMPAGLVGLCRLLGSKRLVTLAVRQADGSGGIYIGSRFYPATVSEAVLIAAGRMEAPA